MRKPDEEFGQWDKLQLLTKYAVIDAQHMASGAVGLSRRNTLGGSTFPGPPDLQLFHAVAQGGGV
jgi:hypothetical protein